MAVKARATVTLASIKDVASTTRYYLLQSSTTSMPAKPTTNPPGGSWAKTEPAYTSGSTNSLYFTDLTVFSDETFVYSDVSLSSSFEAAKTAYNEAIAAKNTANAATSKAAQIQELILGTQTAKTGSWTGVSEHLSSLTDGTIITYWLPFAGNGNATLNLTLSTGTKTGAVACYYGGTKRLTTHYPAGSVIRLTYRKNVSIDGSVYTGWWADANYDSNTNTYDRTRYSQAILAGSSAIEKGTLIVAGADHTGKYMHLSSGNPFDITYPILYANAAMEANKTGTNNYIAIPFAVAPTQDITFVPYRSVYIKGTLSGSIFTPINTAPLTQDIPSSEDGYQYILLGTAYSTANMYLLMEHAIFQYFRGGFKSSQQIAVEAQTNLENVNIGGRNLLQKSGPMEGYELTGSVTTDLDSDGIAVATFAEAENLSTRTVATRPLLSYRKIREKLVTFSVLVRSDQADLMNEDSSRGLNISIHLYPSASSTIYRTHYVRFYDMEMTGDWQKVQFSKEITDTLFSGDTEIEEDATFTVVLQDYSLYSMQAKQMKLEYGNMATDWTPAPEDVDNAIQDSAESVRTFAESCVSQKADEIELSISEVSGVLTTDVQDCQDLIAEKEEELQGSLGNLTTRVSSQEDDLLAYKHETSMYFRFNTDGLNIGKQTDGAVSPFAINIDNEKMAFLQNGMEVAYIQYNRLHINAVEAVDRLSVGAKAHGGYFDFISTQQGMGVKWRAVNEEADEGTVGSASGEELVGNSSDGAEELIGSSESTYNPVTDEEGVFTVDFGGEDT